VNDVVLEGCTPEPLSRYLTALGVLRVVAEQADSDARGRWADDRFTLTTALTEDVLVEFFLNRYQPTPIVAPWNRGSGFRRDQNLTAEKVLTVVAESTDARLAPYRQAIDATWALVDSAAWATLDKRAQVQACRNRLPDDAIQWLDATIVLTENDTEFARLLGGAGGVLGRMDLSDNFRQRVLDALGLARTRKRRGDDRRAWLEHALFGRGRPRLVDGSIGQFDPGGATTGLVNPWTFVLLVEGALLFASGVARRAGSDGAGVATMPFTVRSTTAGVDSSAAGEPAKGEIWAPLWSRATGIAELRRLMSEGRIRLGRRNAVDGLDAARAVASLGVDRGVSAFARHALVERHGQGNIAVPAGRLRVRSRPEVPVLTSLDPWLIRVRSVGDLPAETSAALRAVQQAEYELAARGGPDRLFGVLAAVASLEAAISRSTKLRTDERRPLRPIAGLRARDWLPHLDTENSPELRVAAALASLRTPSGDGLRGLLHPVAVEQGRVGWTDEPAPVSGLGRRRLADVLAQAHAVRAVRQTQERRAADQVDVGQVATAAGPPYSSGARVSVPDVADFVTGALDISLLERCLTALLLLEWDGSERLPRREGDVQPPMPWRLLAPFFHSGPLRRNRDSSVELTLTPGVDWARRLAAGQLEPVVANAVHRLRTVRLIPLDDPGQVVDRVDPHLLSAALLCHLPTPAVTDMLDRSAAAELP
jgi:CRISPR-associated protein Csx17